MTGPSSYVTFVVVYTLVVLGTIGTSWLIGLVR
jgi:hypothetical protein